MALTQSAPNFVEPYARQNTKDTVVVSVEEFTTQHGEDAIDPAERQFFLTNSPYDEQAHRLDLRTVNEENALLAQALVLLEKTREDYATAPYTESFNWPRVFEELKRLVGESHHQWRETSFFVVAFRSQIPPTTVYADLAALDKAAHEEATASGGFLKYWFGRPDVDGRNLATCVWRSVEDAKQGGVGPAHRKAAGAARHLYSHWKIDRHRLTVHEDLSWEITEWSD